MSSSINKLFPEDLEEFMAERHEQNYLIVDVRQPEEYEQSHIPGATLIPLGDLLKHPERLPEDREIVFYCASGRRSGVAASLIADEGMVREPLYNMMGGFHAWEGRALSGFPRLKLFDPNESMDSLLSTAIKLEKGALDFYTEVRKRHAGTNLETVFARLGEAEVQHARSVYVHLKTHKAAADDFESYFKHLSSDILEGGMSVRDAIETLDGIQTNPCITVLEFALHIELSAYELYRTVSNQITSADSPNPFLSLAQAEKGHMRVLSAAFDLCP